eukprot:SAG31_NODE_8447_length_1450_cov_2.035529_1_plen_179_part_00
MYQRCSNSDLWLLQSVSDLRLKCVTDMNWFSVCLKAAQNLAELRGTAKAQYSKFRRKSADMRQATKRTHLKFRSKPTHALHVVANSSTSGAQQVSTIALLWTALSLQFESCHLIHSPLLVDGTDVRSIKQSPTHFHVNQTFIGMNKVKQWSLACAFQIRNQIYVSTCVTNMNWFLAHL